MILDTDSLVKLMVQQVRHNLALLSSPALKDPIAIAAAAAKYQESLWFLRRIPAEFLAKDHDNKARLERTVEKQLDRAEMDVFLSGDGDGSS
jgi:hypothetical protein